METITINLSVEDKLNLFDILAHENLTLDEAANMFIRWLVEHPDKAIPWLLNECKKEENSMIPHMNVISQKELCDHIEDDDFCLRYGNPVAIRCDDGKYVILMAIEYYYRIEEEKQKLQDLIKNKEEI